MIFEKPKNNTVPFNTDPNAKRNKVFLPNMYILRFHLGNLSNDTIHPLCDKVAKKTESDEASSDTPEPVKVLNVLAGDETSFISK